MDDFDLLIADLQRPKKRFSLAPKSWPKPLPSEPPNSQISSNVEAARTDEELRKIVSERKGETVVINFGSSYCHSCHALFPHFYRFTSQFPQLKFVVAQIDYMTEEASELEFTPTFKIQKKGRTVDQFYGANKDILRDRLWLHSDD